MATPEQNFWRLIKPHLPGDVMRVENLATPGTPDVNGCWEGHEYWVELKVLGIKKPATQTDPWHLLDPTQRAWHRKRVAASGKVILLVRCVNHIRLYRNVHATFIRSLDEFITHRPYDWTIFEKTLTLEIQR